MREVLESSHGLVYSQRVLLALVDSGLTREEAYTLVQRNGLAAWDGGRPFLELLSEDDEVTARIDGDALANLFDPDLVHPQPAHRLGASARAVTAPLATGKVREIYPADDDRHLVMVTSDRISAYDAILPTEIRRQGPQCSPRLSIHWFDRRTGDHRAEPPRRRGAARSCRRSSADEEMVTGRCDARAAPGDAPRGVRGVRGYLGGLGMARLPARPATTSGHALPAGLQPVPSSLPEPLFAPATKATRRPRREHRHGTRRWSTLLGRETAAASCERVEPRGLSDAASQACRRGRDHPRRYEAGVRPR